MMKSRGRTPAAGRGMARILSAAGMPPGGSPYRKEGAGLADFARGGQLMARYGGIAQKV